MGHLRPKQFQSDTIEHVFKKLSRSQSRFLVADEVGLGKTIIARGVIQRFQESLKSDKASREAQTDHQLVLYVCSSSDIGKQNIRKLMSEGGEALGDGRASRLTMLFYDEAQSALQAERERQKALSRGQKEESKHVQRGLPLEVVCLTPATSFDFGFPEGRKEERQFLHALLHKVLEIHAPGHDLLRKAATSFFTPPAKSDHWAWRSSVKQKTESEVEWILEKRPNVAEHLMDRLRLPFLDAAFDLEKSSDADLFRKLKVDKRTTILDAFVLAIDECDGYLDRRSEWAEQLKAFRRVVLRRLREQVALVVVTTLQPHLVILDEFQNFSEMLSVNPTLGRGTNTIVRTLFDKDARLLLLSATPYKAATADFEAAEHSHYRRFWDTIEFLFRFHPRGKELLSTIDSNFNLYRQNIQGLKEIGDEQFIEAKKCKKKIEESLREVMVRTERFRYLDDPANGVQEPEVEPWIDTAVSDSVEFSSPLPGLTFQNQDVQYLAWLKRAFRQDQQMFLPEIWSSLPYALNLMPKTYKMISSLYTTGEGLGDHLKPAMRGADAQKFCPSLRDIPFENLDSATPNPKLRELLRQIKSEEIFRHLWVPPTKRYYTAPGDGEAEAPRKRLIFSRWQAVPQAVSVLASLYVEDQLGATDESHGDTLKLAYDSVELAPILFHPSLWLARAGLAVYGRKNCGQISLEQLARIVADHLEQELEDRGIRIVDGRLDDLETIGAVLHRMEPKSFSELYARTIGSGYRYWPKTRQSADDGDDVESESSVRRAIERFHEVSQAEAKKSAKKISRASLRLLTQIAIGGPGVSLLRICLQFGLIEFESLDSYQVAAAGGGDAEKIFAAVLRTAHGPIRRFFNHTHAGLVIRKLEISGKATHLERTAEFCVRNHLPAIMDEHAFLLEEDLPPFEERPGDRAVDLIENLGSSFRIAVGKPVFREVQGQERLRAHNKSVSRHIAQAFVDERGVKDDAGKDLLRDQIRRAFNSPFWPFVLVTTSIGQEGLDFHRYCSDVIHWNLPSSPVAFEQREGRIQRYLGKVIRDAWMKNRKWNEFIASNLKAGGEPSGLKNPWGLVQQKLEKEESEGGRDRRGLSPQWIYEKDGDFAQIRRWIFCHPFSREAVAYRRMRDSVLLYRLALGQARQDDLIRALSQQPIFKDAGQAEQRKIIRELWIDLSPPRLRGASK